MLEAFSTLLVGKMFTFHGPGSEGSVVWRNFDNSSMSPEKMVLRAPPSACCPWVERGGGRVRVTRVCRATERNKETCSSN